VSQRKNRSNFKKIDRNGVQLYLCTCYKQSCGAVYMRKHLAHRRGDCGRTGCAPAQGLGRRWAGLLPAAPWRRVHPGRPPSERRAAAQTMLNHPVENLLGHRCWPARPAGLVAQAKGRRLAAAARAPAAAAGCCSMMEHGIVSCDAVQVGNCTGRTRWPFLCILVQTLPALAVGYGMGTVMFAGCCRTYVVRNTPILEFHNIAASSLPRFCRRFLPAAGARPRCRTVAAPAAHLQL